MPEVLRSGTMVILPLLVAVATALAPGDRPATVTVEHRPLSADRDHVVAFTRANTLYVCLDDLTQAVSGSLHRDGKRIAVTTFAGSANSRTATFSVGSADATLDGRAIHLEAPVVAPYGCAYVPLSFFGAPGVRTRVTFGANHRSGNIALPPGTI